MRQSSNFSFKSVLDSMSLACVVLALSACVSKLPDSDTNTKASTSSTNNGSSSVIPVTNDPDHLSNNAGNSTGNGNSNNSTGSGNNNNSSGNGNNNSSTAVTPQPLAVTRLWSPQGWGYVYSTNANEINQVVQAGWTNEGTQLRLISNSGVSGTAPLYRCYIGGAHFLSRDQNCEGATNELNGAAFGYVYVSAVGQSPALMRYASHVPVMIAGGGGAQAYSFLITTAGLPGGFDSQGVIGYSLP